MGLPRILKRASGALLDSIGRNNRATAGLLQQTSAPPNWHEDFIVHIAGIVRPRIYIELGLYQCAVFNRVTPYAEHLIGVDVNPAALAFMTKSPKTEFVCSTTRSFALELRARALKIDLLFIDADHSMDSVLNDFHSYSPFVSPHGLILIHDTHPEDVSQTHPGLCGDGYKAVPILQGDTDNFEMVTIPIPPGLTICRKRMSQLSWG